MCVGVQDTKLCDGFRLVSVFQGVLEVVAAAIQTLFIHQLSIKVHIQFEHWRFRLLEKRVYAMPNKIYISAKVGKTRQGRQNGKSW